jgi:hypothetical protein
MSGAARAARYRAKGRTITVLLDPETYQLLQTLQQQLDLTQAEAITTALRALSPRKAQREVTEAEIDALLDRIEAQAAAARRLRSADPVPAPAKTRAGLGTVRLRSKPRA